jgi:2'-hydroxyisoflavone reductase
MRTLILGGTVFLGRHVAAEALARGHELTLFNRGVHGGIDGAEHLRGDRTGDLSALEGREWDAVIDTCGFAPEHVALTAGALAERVGHYGFVSSGSAYADWPNAPVSEDSPVFDSDEREYGPLKAACERAAEAAMPGRVLVARAGVIVGPHENIGRLPWWLRPLAEGGEVPAPGPREAELQLIDARDLAAWMLDMAERGGTGAYNAISQPGSATWGELLELAREVTGGGAELRWLDPAAVEAHVEEPWEALPLWPIPSLPGLYGMSAQRAARAGLTLRPLAETVADTWAWLASGGELADWRSELRVSGLSPEAERALLRS